MNHRRTQTGSPTIILDVREGIAEIVLSREAKRNAIDYAMVDTMMQFLDLLEAEEKVRCVILTGVGNAHHPQASSRRLSVPGERHTGS